MIMILTIPSRQPIATEYVRAVEGKRGVYIEFTFEQLVKENLYMEECERWRLFSSNAYYLEYRTTKDHVKVYHQKRCVTYADYKIGMLYISPLFLNIKL